jgi:phenylacetate-CoA ligase
MISKDASSKKAQTITDNIHSKNSIFWMKEQERQMLWLFQQAAKRVPAYKDFLKKHKINPLHIKTMADFARVPETTKDNYLRAYPLNKLVWDGSLDESFVFAATSGTTGAPVYFPRSHELEWQSSIVHELFLNQRKQQKGKPVLVVICFGMGVWIGGLLTYKAFDLIGKKHDRISIITPGINKEEIINALEKLAPMYGEVVLVGYPPFIKDLIDEATHKKINLTKLNMRVILAAENITEGFRDYVVRKTGIANKYLDIMNIYGSADIGTMAFETPLSILLREICAKKPELFAELFPTSNKNPTLVQYIPSFIGFEAPENHILLSGNNSVPLIRYAIGDHGGVFSWNTMKAICAKHGVDIAKEAKHARIDAHLYELPFVHIFERVDLSTKLYGAIINPGPIRQALEQRSLEESLTGKFTMMTKQTEKLDQYLEIHIELKQGVVESALLKEETTTLIVEHLLAKNAEYRNNYSMIPEKVTPKLVFWPYEYPEYFKPGIKQKWVRKHD